jgi:RNA polymerase sigma-70 factor (ECF subfamily)
MTTLITPMTIRDLSPGLFAFAYRAVRQREEAEDLVQETWLSALRTAQSFEGRSTLRTWLISILRRRMADRYRREHRTELLAEEEYAHEASSAAEKLEIRTAALVAADALSKLTELERDAVVLCDVRDLDRDEASERMGVTRGHLRVLLHRGRHKLEQTLAARGVRA